MTLGRLSRVLLGIAVAAAMMTPRPGDARAGDGYTVTVRLVLVRGESTARTDSAVWIPPDGGEEDVSRGAQLPAGGTLKVFFPVVTLYLDDAGGNRFVLQCPGCTEDDPLVLTVGDPGDGTPFRQSGGRVTWEIEPVREGLFQILLDVLRGPGEELVPVAVRGTLFRTEAGGGTHALTVAEGSVSYGEGTAARLLEGGEVLAGGEAPATAAAGPAAAEVLEEMRTLMQLPAAGTGLPEGPGGMTVRPPVNMAWKWLTLGAGIVTAGAGGAVLMMAASARDRARIDAQRRYVELVDWKTSDLGYTCDDAKDAAAADARTLYDDRFRRDVEPRVVAGWVLTGLGGAAAVGGLVWLLVDQVPAAGASLLSPVAVLPAPLPGGGGLTVDWSF